MKKISEILQEVQTEQYQIYCDMDGVLTDFDERYEHFTGLSPEEMDEELTRKYGKGKAQFLFWTKVDPLGVKFWSEMNWMDDGRQLWEYIKPYNPKLLSSPSRSQTSKEGKQIWTDENLPGTELILRQANKKQEFAGPNNILIDDRPSNIEQWKAKGGIGILHVSAADTIRQLKELGFKEKSISEIKAIPNFQLIPGEKYDILMQDDFDDDQYWDTYVYLGRGKDQKKKPNESWNNHHFFINVEFVNYKDAPTPFWDDENIKLMVKNKEIRRAQLDEIKAVPNLNIPHFLKYDPTTTEITDIIYFDWDALKIWLEKNNMDFQDNENRIFDRMHNVLYHEMGEEIDTLDQEIAANNFELNDLIRSKLNKINLNINKHIISLFPKKISEIKAKPTSIPLRVGGFYEIDFQSLEYIGFEKNQTIFTNDEAGEYTGDLHMFKSKNGEIFGYTNQEIIEMFKNNKIRPDINEIKAKPGGLGINFSDENIYYLIYKGNGSNKMYEIMMPGEVAQGYILGNYFTFRPSGHDEYIPLLMNINWFEIDEKYGSDRIESAKELKYIKDYIDKGKYKII